jgi:hypothetical protein
MIAKIGSVVRAGRRAEKQTGREREGFDYISLHRRVHPTGSITTDAGLEDVPADVTNFAKFAFSVLKGSRSTEGSILSFPMRNDKSSLQLSQHYRATLDRQPMQPYLETNAANNIGTIRGLASCSTCSQLFSIR